MARENVRIAGTVALWLYPSPHPTVPATTITAAAGAIDWFSNYDLPGWAVENWGRGGCAGDLGQIVADSVNAVRSGLAPLH